MYDGDKTTFLKVEEARESRNWFIIDASGKTLGRLCTILADLLRGKHRPDFTPHVDCGAGVIVINVEKVTVTGSKKTKKIYRRYTGSMRGLREITFEDQQEKNPAEIIERGVWGMMPKNRLSKAQMKHLRTFVGEKHNLQAQLPVAINV